MKRLPTQVTTSSGKKVGPAYTVKEKEINDEDTEQISTILNDRRFLM